MKKGLLFLLVTTMTFSMYGCGNAQENANSNNSSQLEETTHKKEEETAKQPEIKIKDSPDKYTWYIKNYVGKNCASFGYTSLGGDRMDHYGASYLELIFLTEDGSYIDIETDDELKTYVVTGQNIEPNAEMKLTFDVDEETGEEYENLVEYQTYEEIVLSVKKVKGKNFSPELTQITASPDKYTWYVPDFVGRNLANCGYISLSGDLMHRFGPSYAKCVIIPEDGSYIDPEDKETLKKYVVTSQNIAPNTELNLTLQKDSDGNEYDNLVEYQNITEIELNVKPIQDEQ